MSLPRPPLVPPESKLPPRYVAPSRAQRRVIYLLIVLLFVLGFALISTVAVMFGQPELVGLERQRDLALTENAIESTRAGFVLTEAFLITSAAQQQSRGVDLQATQAALVNRESLIRGTETQQAVNADITRTAVADTGARQATESAANASATQAALAQLATQVQNDFVATQTAIADRLWTPLPTAPPNIVTLDRGYINTPEQLQNTSLPPNLIWSATSTGLVAQVDHATLLTQAQNFGQNYTVLADFTPLPDRQTSYDVLFGVNPQQPAGQGYGVRVFYGDGRLSSVTLYQFENVWVTNLSGIPVTEGQVLDSLTGTLATADALSVRVQVIGGLINVIINNEPLLSATLDGVTQISGSAGVQVKAGARIQRLTVESAG